MAMVALMGPVDRSWREDQRLLWASSPSASRNRSSPIRSRARRGLVPSGRRRRAARTSTPVSPSITMVETKKPVSGIENPDH